MSTDAKREVGEVLAAVEAVIRDDEVDLSEVDTPTKAKEAQLGLVAHIRDQLSSVLEADEANARKSELLQCYRRGFKHGVGAIAKDTRFVDHPRGAIASAYERGYEHGRGAAMTAFSDECERLQYDPMLSVLRSPAPAEPPSAMPPIGGDQ